MSTSYAVIIEEYARRHYIKSFEKKYKGAWDVTLRAIIEELKRFDSLLETSIAETISEIGDMKICKTEFRVHGTKESRKSSGNRCIVAVHTKISTVHILLAYNKNDLGDGNETSQWKTMIRENYPAYKDLR
ncbi:MAG: hypothetical protein Q8Q17_01080 [bacterium]|nr:hypothetical protein [bacterium]